VTVADVRSDTQLVNSWDNWILPEGYVEVARRPWRRTVPSSSLYPTAWIYQLDLPIQLRSLWLSVDHRLPLVDGLTSTLAE
jgi:hypothetical protein